MSVCIAYSCSREIFGTKTTIKAKTKDSGKIEIEYYSQEDLERITQLLAQ